MVVLNLRGDCLARTATNFQQGMTDKRFLELEIRAWLHSPARKRQLAAEASYDGAQDVLHRRRVALDDDGHIKVLDHLPNNRLVNNIYAKMVDQKTNYSFGRPFSFDTEDKGYAKALNSVLGPKFRRVMRNVGEGAWIGGKCWLFPYYEGGELALSASQLTRSFLSGRTPTTRSWTRRSMSMLSWSTTKRKWRRTS